MAVSDIVVDAHALMLQMLHSQFGERVPGFGPNDTTMTTRCAHAIRLPLAPPKMCVCGGCVKVARCCCARQIGEMAG